MTPSAADPHFQAATPQAVLTLRQAYRLPERYVLYVGANKAHKNLVRLLEAWAKSDKPKSGDWGLVLAGPGCDRVARRQQNVVCLGHVPEEQLPALYTGAAVYVQPSVWEGFGLSVLEAMACGVPVVCSDTPALIEVTGTAALRFAPENVTAMAIVLSRVMANGALQGDLRRYGYERVRRFSWQETARQTLAVYRALSTTAGSRACGASRLS